jgi:hypothetical protein
MIAFLLPIALLLVIRHFAPGLFRVLMLAVNVAYRVFKTETPSYGCRPRTVQSSTPSNDYADAAQRWGEHRSR